MNKLRPECIREAAQQKCGLADFAEADIAEPLQKLLWALQSEADLSTPGTEAMFAHLVDCLAARARIQDCVKRHPRILEEEIAAPVIITGLPRSGTTKLQRSLAATSAFQFFPLWKILNPLPLDGDPPGVDSRIGAAEQLVAQMKAFNPRFCAGHPTDALAADEEAMLLEQTFFDDAHCWYSNIPGYLAWLQKSPLDPSYRWLKIIMQAVQWLDEPGERKRPWLLKSPVHLGRFDEVFAVFPDAIIVQCHRDLAQVIPSAAALAEAMRLPYCDRPDRLAAGRYALDLLGHALENNLEARKKWRQAGKTIIDAEFDDIVDNVAAVVNGVFSGAHLDFTPEAARSLADWEDVNPRHLQGEFTYDAKTYGITPAAIQDRFSGYLAERSATGATKPCATLAAAWSDYHATLDEMRRVLEATPRFKESPADRAKVYHALMEMQAMAYNLAIAPRMLHPRVYSHTSWMRDVFTLAQNCQDFIYSNIFLDGRQRYRISGRMGDTCLFILQVFNGAFGDAGLKTTSNTDLSGWAVGADRRFEVILSGAPEPGHWIALEPDVEYQMVFIRRALADWHGDPGEIRVERLSPLAGNHYDADEFDESAIAGRIRRAAAFVRFIIEGNVVGLYDRYLHTAADRKNELALLPGESLGLGANASSNYAVGIFDLQEDEALILTLDSAPDGVYWSYQLGDVWSRSLNFSDRQSTLNMREAAVDADGTLRVVIARQDPGIANWLDPCGRRTGTVILRNYRATAAPVPAARKVRLFDLPRHLPENTRRVSAEQRALSLQRRREGLLNIYGE